MEARLDTALLAAIFVLIGVVVMAVNLLTIAVVLRTPQLRHSDQWQANLYVLSLAVSDTLVGVSLLWVAALYIPDSRDFIDRQYVLCISGVIVTANNICVSFITLQAIALDRLLYIVYPYYYRRYLTEQRTKAIIFVIWCGSLIGSCTFIPFNNNYEHMRCKPLGLVLTSRIKTVFIALLIVESVVTCSCYLRIACVVRSQKRRIQAARKAAGTPGNERTSSRAPGLSQHSEQAKTSSEPVTPCQSTHGDGAVATQPGTLLGNAELRVETSSDAVQTRSAAGTDSYAHSLHVSQLSANSGAPTPESNCKTKPQDGMSTSVCVSPSQSPTVKTMSVQLFVIINTSFITFWIPFILFSIFFDRGPDNDDVISGILFVAVSINSAINFAVYAWKNIEYRNAYKNFFKDLSRFLYRR